MTSTQEPMSVVVPTRDRPSHLHACLTSVSASVDALDQLIVVDSASVHSDVRSMATSYGARYVRCERPGVNRARNAGWRASEHTLVAFVDDDVTVSAGWAGAYRLAAQRHPESAFFTGQLRVPDEQGTVARPVATREGDEPAVLDREYRGVFGHGANLLLRRDALEAVGGFDEQLGTGARFRSAPELDLFDRLLAAGLTGRYVPSALGWHDQWRAPRELLALDWRYGVGAGARFAKLVRADRPRARQAAHEFFVEWSAAEFAAAFRHRHRFGMAAPAVRVTGAAVGFTTALTVPLRDGHLADRGPFGRAVTRVGHRG